ncbi:DUF433 domain-containing protein [Microcystis aeruginosa]|uniref:DUF433 domain-containing protein n=1 Tax=Microcystis aeruginosa TaxID=1126 RepID=UPI000933E162|nr:DUF433 domain-containing protein [Microcystis aeruginosa]
MQLEDYFLFISEDDIRIKGHRLGIDNVLFYFLEGYTPEEINAIYPDLSLEKIYATITYYLQNRQKIDAYLLRLKNWRETRYQESLKNPSPQREKMRKIATSQKPLRGKMKATTASLASQPIACGC